MHQGRLKTTVVDAKTFLAKRAQRGARVADIESIFEDSLILFGFSENDLISETCIECWEFMLSATRNAAEATAVLDRPDFDGDPHLMTALKKYVEDTGESLKQVDDRLGQRGSSLVELFPGQSGDAATWRDLIAQRDVIAHKILTVDDKRVQQEADRDYRTLHRLLRNIIFVPTMTDLEIGRLFEFRLQFSLLHRLPAATPGGKVTAAPGSSLILVCDDARKGLITFRLGRTPQNKLLFASSVVGTYTVSIQTDAGG